LILLPSFLGAKMLLKDRVVLITGVSGDIDFATSEHFLQDGAFFIAHYNQNKGRLEALKPNIRIT
jgi:NAD(P)-dependent dehydrogenase (short-subunit alcohol dehydrogenase family)